MPSTQTTAEVIYMNLLAAKGSDKLLDRSSGQVALSPLFDPQGRLLVDITLDDKEIATLMGEINAKISASLPQTIDGLAVALGRKPSTTTTISVDIQYDHPTPLSQLYYGHLSDALQKGKSSYSKEQAKLAIKQLQEQPKGSIIALQHEFHFHLSLVSRIYRKIKQPHIPEEKMQAAFANTMSEVNKLVIDAFAQAIKIAMKSGTFDLAALNKALDKTRKDILPQAHHILTKNIIQQTGILFNKKDLQKAKKIAEETTATPNDVFHLSPKQDIQGIAVLVAGSDNTAHHRVAGEQFAHRQLITHFINPQGHISANPNSRIQIRTPTPAVKKGLTEDGDYIRDVSVKFTALKEHYLLADRLKERHPDVPLAFYYHSYTSMNDRLGDWRGNLQSQSAAHVLQGMHRYNASQLKNGTGKPIFCLVQNIAVNGFGDTLSNKSTNELVAESTLMADLALLHSLYDLGTSKDKDDIQHVFLQYQQFLFNTSDPIPYFSSSEKGKKVKEQIQTLKNRWRQDLIPLKPEKGTIDENAKLALKKLMTYDLHHTHEYAKLVQVLSVFCSECSLGGCKSGNERAQAINGRVAILDMLHKNKNQYSLEQNELANYLEQLASEPAKADVDESSPGEAPLVEDDPEEALLVEDNPEEEALLAESKREEEVHQQAKAFKDALDKEYNRVGLQGAPALVSMLDQGAAAKVKAKKGAISYWSNRNMAEEQASVMSNLHQRYAGPMQAHKDMTKHMQKAWRDIMQAAWNGPPQTWRERWWDPLSSVIANLFGGGKIGSAVGAIVGAIVTIITFPASLVIVWEYKRKTDALNALSKMTVQTSPLAETTSHGLMNQSLTSQRAVAPTVVDPTVSTMTKINDDDQPSPGPSVMDQSTRPVAPTVVVPALSTLTQINLTFPPRPAETPTSAPPASTPPASDGQPPAGLKSS